MTVKEFRELIKNLNDEEEIGFEISKYDGEILYAYPTGIDEENTIVILKQEIIYAKDIIKL